MSKQNFWALLILLLFASPVATAQSSEEQADLAPVTTPTTLVALLPEGGIEAVQFDHWYVYETLCPAGTCEDHVEDTRSSDYYHSWARVEGDHLVFGSASGNGTPSGSSMQSRMVYTVDGQFVSYELSMRAGCADHVDVIFAMVEEDEVVARFYRTTGSLPVDRDDPALDEEPTRIRRIPMGQIETVICGQWSYLVHAYHLRQGNAFYHYNSAERIAPGSADVFIQNLGSETIEHDGQEMTAHRLRRTFFSYGTGTDTPETHRSTMLVLDSGHLFSSTFIGDGGVVYTNRISTAEEVAELFQIDPDHAGEEPAVQE